jgi:hypothetical protein
VEVNGAIESITTDWRGDTLAAPVMLLDDVLEVADTSDFDEEDGGWVTIADADPVAYTTVDHDASTVTLAAPSAAAHEEGDPVVVWDPTVPPLGAKVVEYVASVMTDHGPMDAVLPHAVVPLAGVDRLLGASVALDDDDAGEWYVSQVYGRESTIDQSFIGIPFITLYVPADASWPNDTTSTYTTIDDWAVGDFAEDIFTHDPATGRTTVLEDGFYLFLVAVRWNGNTSGRRYIQLWTTPGGVDTLIRDVPGSPADSAAFTQQVNIALPLAAGESFYVKARQTSGAALDISGSPSGIYTMMQAVRLQA